MGDLGYLYVEILQCDNLPAVNLLNRPRKGNPFVTIVHEDSIATTDAIPDCANPRYLPWARRAFKLRIKHASSSLFLRVHDWSRETMASARKHDALGRIAIQLDQFRSGTTYNLAYNLYDSGRTANIPEKGITRIRLRVEWKRGTAFP